MKVYEYLAKSICNGIAYFNKKSSPLHNIIMKIIPDSIIVEHSKYNSALSEKEEIISNERKKVSELERKAIELDEQVKTSAKKNETLEKKINEMNAGHQKCVAEYIEKIQQSKAECESLLNKYNNQVGGNKHLAHQNKKLLEHIFTRTVQNYLATHPKDFVVAADNHDRIVAASDRACRKLGISVKEQALGKNVYSYIPEGNKIRESLKQKIIEQINEGSYREQTRQILPNLLTKNPDNEVNYKTNVVIIPQVIWNAGNKNPEYLGCIIVEESWHERNARKKKEKKETIKVKEKIDSDIKETRKRIAEFGYNLIRRRRTSQDNS